MLAFHCPYVHLTHVSCYSTVVELNQKCYIVAMYICFTTGIMLGLYEKALCMLWTVVYIMKGACDLCICFIMRIVLKVIYPTQLANYTYVSCNNHKLLYIAYSNTYLCITHFIEILQLCMFYMHPIKCNSHSYMQLHTQEPSKPYVYQLMKWIFSLVASQQLDHQLSLTDTFSWPVSVVLVMICAQETIATWGNVYYSSYQQLFTQNCNPSK